jgi:hypothetical protein
MSSYGAVTITDTPTRIVPGNNAFRPVLLEIIGSTTVYVGDNNIVTVDDGLPIIKRQSANEIRLLPGQELWGVCASSQTENIRYFTHTD